jgi:hypothetical protein
MSSLDTLYKRKIGPSTKGAEMILFGFFPLYVMKCEIHKNCGSLKTTGLWSDDADITMFFKMK